MFESTPKKTPIANQRLPEIDIIKDLAISLLRRSTLDDLLWDIADAIGKMPGFEDSVVYLREGEAMVQRAAYGVKRNEDGTLNKPISIPIGSGIVGHVASTGVPELISDISQDARYIFDLYAGQSELAVPVSFEGRVIAVLDTESKKLDAYSRADLEILQTMANISAPRIGSALADQERVRISRELAELNSELEQRVASRTHELEQANADILRQRDRLESILNSMQDGMICFDQKGTVRLMSPSASRLTGWPIEEAIGRKVASVFVPASRIDREVFFRLSKLNTPSETEIRSRDGRLLDVRWTLGESRQLGRAENVLVFSDVTGQKQLAKQAEQVQRIESLGILAGGIAHDFNNNLTAIQSAMESIPVEDSRTSAALELSRVACDSARSLAKQLLTFSNGGAPARRPTSLKSLIEKSIALVLEPMNVETQWQPQEFDISVYVDPDQVSQVFTNLLLNAAQAMSGAGTVRLKVAYSKSSDFGRKELVEVVIQDEGTGIPNEHLGSIFDPYFTSRSDGIGLGLTISYHILKRHDGSLVIENWEGGALARVRIPLSAENVIANEKSLEPRTSASSSILLLEDETLVRDGVRMLLESLGHTVLEATHGDEAVEVFEAAQQRGQSIGLMILDLRIKGGRGGAEVVPELRGINADVPILACSGYHKDPIMSNFKANGFDGALPKPFRRDALAEILSQHLKQ